MAEMLSTLKPLFTTTSTGNSMGFFLQEDEEEPDKADNDKSSPNRGQADEDQQLVTSSGRVVKRTTAR